MDPNQQLFGKRHNIENLIIGSLVGFSLGLLIVWYVKHRAAIDLENNNKSIYYGYATPDENGYIGWSRFPETGRFPEVG
jgi:hypothetical protein